MILHTKGEIKVGNASFSFDQNTPRRFEKFFHTSFLVFSFFLFFFLIKPALKTVLCFSKALSEDIHQLRI